NFQEMHPLGIQRPQLLNRVMSSNSFNVNVGSGGENHTHYSSCHYRSISPDKSQDRLPGPLMVGRDPIGREPAANILGKLTDRGIAIRRLPLHGPRDNRSERPRRGVVPSPAALESRDAGKQGLK